MCTLTGSRLDKTFDVLTEYVKDLPFDFVIFSNEVSVEMLYSQSFNKSDKYILKNI